MCQETTYRFESRECGCVYVRVVTCEDARIPVDVVRDAKKRWPKCRGKRAVRKVDGGTLGVGCWELHGRNERLCEKRMKVHVQVKR